MEKLYKIYIQDNEQVYMSKILGFTYATDNNEALKKYFNTEPELKLLNTYVKAERITIADYMKLYK